MTLASPTVPAEILSAACDRLRELHDRDETIGELDFRHWVPRSARTARQRLFVASCVDGEPRYVAKLPLDPQDRRVIREAAVLADLPTECRHRTRLITRTEAGFVMRWVPGLDLPDLLRRSRTSAELTKRLVACVEWCVSSQACRPVHLDRTGPPPSAVEIVQSYLGSLADVEDRALAALETSPVGSAHGDFGPWNVRIDPMTERIVVIDWEDYRAEGVPALDVVNLIFTSALAIFPGYAGRGFDWLYYQVFHREGAFRVAATAGLRRYAQLTGVLASEVAALFPVSCLWSIRRIREQGRPVADLYYEPFAAKFTRDAVGWLERLDD